MSAWGHTLTLPLPTTEIMIVIRATFAVGATRHQTAEQKILHMYTGTDRAGAELFWPSLLLYYNNIEFRPMGMVGY